MSSTTASPTTIHTAYPLTTKPTINPMNAPTYQPITTNPTSSEKSTNKPTNSGPTVTITTSPTNAIFLTLPFVGGCPATFNEFTANTYEAGNMVSKDAIVYQCRSWPYSLFCSQAAFKPDLLGSKLEHWRQAWQIIGQCSGTISPTAVPTSPTGLIGCPVEWASGDITKYKENDRVSVIVKKSSESLTKAIYKCRAWPISLYCAQFSPIDPIGGSLGWVYVESCSGTIAPIASPTLIPGTVVIDGCPSDFSGSVASKNVYKSGDRVAWAVSTSPYKVVYQCREFPNSGYCNQKGFTPGEQYDYMAWTVIGPCDGTMKPTSAPTAFIPGTSCTYTKVYNPTASTPSSVVTSVGVWSAGTLYEDGDQVRVGAKKFQCKPWPYYLWCRSAAYAPTDSATGLWTEAWTPSGSCLA